jgi:hypothetical protein
VFPIAATFLDVVYCTRTKTRFGGGGSTITPSSLFYIKPAFGLGPDVGHLKTSVKNVLFVRDR